MENSFISNQVCELLAHQMVEAQAEVLKHEAIVKNIRQTIVDKKAKIIKEFVFDKLFRIKDKEVIVTKVEARESDNGILVILKYAQNPDSAVKGLELTRKELQLFSDYREAFARFVDSFDKDWARKAEIAASNLSLLKNGIKLTDLHFCSFSFSEARNPEFYEKTGVYVGYEYGVSVKRLMLEDVVTKRFL